MRPDAHTLLAAYAADSVDAAERADVEAHLAECDGCRADLREHRETLAQLASAVAEAPPARLRDAVLSRLDSTAQLPPLVPAPDDGTERGPAHGARPAVTDPEPAPGRRRRPTLSRALFGLAATVLAATALGGMLWGWESREELAEVRAEQAAVQEVLQAPDLVTARADVTLPDGSVGDEVVVLASPASDVAVLLTAGLPEAPEGSTWQAWTLSGDSVRPADAFDAADGTTVALHGGLADADAVAVSLEPAGGSQQPTTAPVVVLPLA